MNGIENRIIAAANSVVEAKKIAPASNMHNGAMSRLTDLLAKNPEAIKTLSELQTRE